MNVDSLRSCARQIVALTMKDARQSQVVSRIARAVRFRNEVSIRFTTFGKYKRDVVETRVASKWIKLIHFFAQPIDCVICEYTCS